jgi:hypothetical protein
MIGRRLGPCEIITKLGEGWMEAGQHPTDGEARG